MQGQEFMKFVTPDSNLNEQLAVICVLMEAQIMHWTRGQTKVIFEVIEGKSQQQIADEIGVGQSAINNRLRLALWKDLRRRWGSLSGC
jgi:hypothetical protein